MCPNFLFLILGNFKISPGHVGEIKILLVDYLAS